MWEYSDKVKDHFKNPRNVGEIKDADAIGQAGALSCGDKLKLYLKIEDNIIKDAKFQTFGCGSAVAASSILTEMIIGKTIEEAKKITNKQIADELDGLPPEKMHCSVMGREALEDALKNYLNDEDWSELDEEETEEESKIICHCFGVNEKQIIDAIKINGAKNLEDVSKLTGAAMACGRCKDAIEAIIHTYVKEENKVLNPIQKIIKINNVIETVISPELQKDFGDIELIDVKDNIVIVQLKGHCSSCSNAKLTLKNFVERKLKELVDDEITVTTEE